MPQSGTDIRGPKDAQPPNVVWKVFQPQKWRNVANIGVVRGAGGATENFRILADFWVGPIFLTRHFWPQQVRLARLG